jgi:hypothetical protein
VVKQKVKFQQQKYGQMNGMMWEHTNFFNLIVVFGLLRNVLTAKREVVV